MQSISRRGFATLINLSRFSNSPTLALVQYAPRRICAMPTKMASKQTASMHSTRKYDAAAVAVKAETEPSNQENGLITRFEDLGRDNLIHQTVLDTITGTMKLETMTPVQSQTINEALRGIDTLALAKTGTGKTVAFLLPVIQRILETCPQLQHKQRRASINIRSIIISPTRELAEQIAKEAKRMVSNTGIEIGLAVGGTGRNASLRDMQRYGCNILVGTPGRLNDLLSDRQSGIAAPHLNSLVLDEADRLLDQGFGPAIKEIYQLLPSKLEADRQTLMFSATMDKEVMGLVSYFMKKDYRTVRTVSTNEVETHERVLQHVVVTNGLENQIPSLFELIKRESIAEESFKAMVFFNTSAEATLTHAMYEKASLSKKTGIRGVVMHARLSQNTRTKTSQNFRISQKAIMFASDVAARGMDFPNVTHVIQVGLPKDRDTYIHRIGRTGRAGKEGQGWVLLSPWDTPDVQKKLRGLPIQMDKSLETAALDMSQNHAVAQGVADILTDSIQSAKMVDYELLSNAFRSSLSVGQVTNKGALIDSLNQRAIYGWGMETPPSISHTLAQKLGFLKVSQLRIGSDERRVLKTDDDPKSNASRGSKSRLGGSSPGRDMKRRFEDRDDNSFATNGNDSYRGSRPSASRGGRSAGRGRDRGQLGRSEEYSGGDAPSVGRTFTRSREV